MKTVTDTKIPGTILTVVIRDDAPMVHCGDTPSYRSVRISFTHDQFKQLTMHGMESVSKCFIDE